MNRRKYNLVHYMLKIQNSKYKVAIKAVECLGGSQWWTTVQSPALPSDEHNVANVGGPAAGTSRRFRKGGVPVIIVWLLGRVGSVNPHSFCWTYPTCLLSPSSLSVSFYGRNQSSWKGNIFTYHWVPPLSTSIFIIKNQIVVYINEVVFVFVKSLLKYKKLLFWPKNIDWFFVN